MNMNRRKFLTRSLCCMSMLAFSACSRRQGSVYDLFEGSDKMGHVEIHLTEHCNLNCKYCSHFSCIAEEEYYNIQNYEKDIIRLAKVTASKISNIQLLGGEPLLHPDIIEIFNITRKYFPESNIDLITNGLRLRRQKEDFWKTMHKNNIFLCPSFYPVGINWKSVLKKAKKYGVNVTTDGREEKITLKNIEKHRITHFYKLNLDLKGTQTWNSGDCPFGPACCNFINGKLYPCFVISNIRHFNKKFSKKLPVTKNDYINIYEIENIKQINDFLYNKMPVPFCKYCMPHKEGFKWENAEKHSITEWT